MRLSLVPQERRFYALFKRQGELVSESLDQLRNGLLEGQTRHPRLRELEHECDDVTHEIYNLINQTFVTPFEREDIYDLASSLDEVVDLAEEVSDKIDLYRVQEITPSARRMGEALWGSLRLHDHSRRGQPDERRHHRSAGARDGRQRASGADSNRQS